MQIVHKLGDIGHIDLVGMTIECVEGKRGRQGVPEATHLFEEMAFVDLRPGRMPAAPLVDYELDLVLGIELA